MSELIIYDNAVCIIVCVYFTTEFYCPYIVHYYSVKRGIGYFLFDKGLWQWFQLQYCPSTQCIKCYITIHHTEHPPRDQLHILLQQRKNLIVHLNTSIAKICKSYMPSAEPPVTCLECPHHECNIPPHIELDIASNEELVCDYEERCQVHRIDKKHYMLLFKPLLPSQQSGMLVVQIIIYIVN